MAERTAAPPASTFVIRFWREWSASSGRWRGRVEHVQSGRSADFADLSGVLQFIGRFGVMEEDNVWKQIGRPPSGGNEPRAE